MSNQQNHSSTSSPHGWGQEEDEEHGPQEIFLDDDDIAEIKEMLDGDDDVPMDEDDDDVEEVEDGPDDGPDEDDQENDTAPVTDTSARQFAKHQQPIFTLSTHPKDPVLVVSGGEDDTGYLWRLDTGEEIAKLSGHTDSVVASGWSTDGELVATGGMDGRVRVWRRSKNTPQGSWEYSKWEFLTVLEGMEEISWLDWHPNGAVLACGTGDGTVWMWRLPSGDNMNVFSGHTAPVTCGRFLPDGKRLITASEDGTLIVWDPRSGAPVHKLTDADGRFRFDGGVTCLAVNAASTSAIVGGADGALRIVNLTNGTVAQSLESHAEGESVEAVAWSAGTAGSVGLWVSVGTDKKVKVFEASTGAVRWTGEHDDAVTSLVLHPASTHLLTTGSVDRSLKTWDLRTGKLVQTSTGHQDVLHVVAVSSDGRRLVSGSDDGTARVYDVSSAQ